MSLLIRYAMKRFAFWAVAIAIGAALSVPDASARDLSGHQSPAPYSVFSTISAESPKQGRSAVAFGFEESGDDFSRFSSQFAIGITNTVEAGLNVPYVDNSTSGLEDISLSLKHRFFRESKYGPSVAYLLTTSIGSSNEELSTDGRVGGGLIASKRVGPVMGHLNLFYSVPYDPALDDEVRASAAIVFSAAHNFKILGEVYTRKSHYSEHKMDQQEARIGYMFNYGDDLYTVIGVGFGLNDKKPDYRVMASLSFLFTGGKKSIEKVYE